MGKSKSNSSKCSENWKSLQKELSQNKTETKTSDTTATMLNQTSTKRKMNFAESEPPVAEKIKKGDHKKTLDIPTERKVKKGKLKHDKAKMDTNKDGFAKNKLTKNIPQKVETGGSEAPKKKRKKLDDIWFDDIPFEDIMEAEEDSSLMLNVNKKSNQRQRSHTAKKLTKSNAYGGLTKVIAMDCEMVGVGEGGRESVLARVSLVNQFGKCIYDKFVKSREEVTDYRTFVSGVRPSDLENADKFDVVQKEVSDILHGRILVGHALWNDMKVLFLDHPKKCVRDTAKYKPFKTMVGGKSPALRVLCSKILGVQVQKGEHSSVQDAQAAMRLYTMFKKQWEAENPNKTLSKNQKKKRKSDSQIKLMLENT
uniref:RNA exonuclease 4 n=1 Tax=Phallusia mammillata TaxID=59560 RepID=A0A6F9DQ06_9ASCI|nr:RNA exonuclease 4-like [Phallusia mammillata]